MDSLAVVMDSLAEPLLYHVHLCGVHTAAASDDVNAVMCLICLMHHLCLWLVTGECMVSLYCIFSCCWDGRYEYVDIYVYSVTSFASAPGTFDRLPHFTVVESTDKYVRYMLSASSFSQYLLYN